MSKRKDLENGRKKETDEGVDGMMSCPWQESNSQPTRTEGKGSKVVLTSKTLEFSP